MFQLWVEQADDDSFAFCQSDLFATYMCTDERRTSAKRAPFSATHKLDNRNHISKFIITIITITSYRRIEETYHHHHSAHLFGSHRNTLAKTYKAVIKESAVFKALSFVSAPLKTRRSTH
jgi:hypothetical protein